VSTPYETVLRYLSRNANAKIFASMLGARNMQEVMALTFSLSGLGNRSPDQSIDSHDFNLGGLLLKLKPVERTSLPNRNQFVPAGSQINIHRSKRSFGDINPNLDMTWALRFLLPESSDDADA